MPRNRTPMAIREVTGTAHRNKHRQNPNEPKPVNGIGPAPSHLTELQKTIWDEVVAVSVPGVLGDTDRLALEVLAKLIDTMRRDFESMTAAQITQLINLCGRFGMTPVDRMKIQVPGKPKTNGFADL